MKRIKKLVLTFILSVAAALTLCLGAVFSISTKTASAAVLSTENWTLAGEGLYSFRIQNGTQYWTGNTDQATTASMLDYTEINGKTLTEINEERPGSVTVTLQPAAANIGSFYRININQKIANFTTTDIGTVVVRAGWSHTDNSGNYTIDTDLYFAHGLNKWSNDDKNSPWKYITPDHVVDISDTMRFVDQGIQAEGTRAILIESSGESYWTQNITPNEGGGSFLNMLYINGTSVREWNKQAHAALNAGEITDITYGSQFNTIKNNKGDYAPIFVSNSGPTGNLGSISQVWIPTGYIPNVSSFKVAKGYANLEGETLYYVSKDVEYVKSGNLFVKVESSVDISDSFKFLVQTKEDGTMLYYIHTNNVQYWTHQYNSANAYSINEQEWLVPLSNADVQGGAVQMSYIEFNGKSIYDINATDNKSYEATQGNIASGSKYAPILAYLTPLEMGNSIKLRIPNKYPTGSGTAADNHKTITIKKGFYVVDTSTNIKYEVTKDVQWDYEDGTWVEHYETTKTSVLEARMFGSASDAFAGIKLANSDYASAPNTYKGDKQTAKTFAQSANFLSHILIDGQPLAMPGEAFLNVWSNYGYFTFRPGNNTATEITVLAGCRFPTYKALSTGVKEAYVTTEDITFIKDETGAWVVKPGVIAPGEYDTGVKGVTYASDNANNWMTFSLTSKDYPKASKIYDVEVTEAQVSALNLYDKIVVDGFTLRSRIAQYGNVTEVAKINLGATDCFALRIPGAAGALNGAKKVTIKAGAQFPSYAYVTEGVEGYYITKEEVTFENVNGSGVWERQYRATFKADDKVVDVVEYVASTGFTAPEVPEKEGYYGAWENYTANGDITVNAVYTKKPTALGKTGVAELRYLEDNGQTFLVVKPANSDYPQANLEGNPYDNLPLDISHLQKFNLLDYVTINGTTLRELGVKSMMINKWTRPGLSLETTLSNSMEIVIKKGCEIPSYAFWKNPNGEVSCYVTDADYICTYNAGGETAFTIVSENADLNIPEQFTNHYVLSDLAKLGYGKTSPFKDGVEVLNNSQFNDTALTKEEREALSEAEYRYGYVEPGQAFTLSFDFRFTGALPYDTFNIQLGTEGSVDYGGNKYHFGWRIYLLRLEKASDVITSNFCVEYFSNTSSYGGNITGSANKVLGSAALEEGKVYSITIGYRLVDAATGTVEVFTALNAFSRTDTYVLGGDFVKFAAYANSLSMNAHIQEKGTVTVSDPGEMPENVQDVQKVQFFSDDTMVAERYEGVTVLPDLNPVEYGKAGFVLVGWTTNINTVPDLYPVGYEYSVDKATSLYAVWIRFSLLSGASVRTVTGSSGIRFTTMVDDTVYNAGVSMNLITEIGTIVAPTEYLTFKDFTHEGLGAGYYVESVTKKWQEPMGDCKVYTASFINMSYDQYDRAFSARGYMKISYTTGEGYIYTAYNQDIHSRSIYEVATLAYEDYKGVEAIESYVGDIADITVGLGGDVGKQINAKGGYELSNIVRDGKTFTITLSKAVKGVTLNGKQLIMGYLSKVVVGTDEYLVENYELSVDGLKITFDLDLGAPEKSLGNDYYFNLVAAYGERNDYSVENKALIDSIVAESGEDSDWEEEGAGWDCYDYYLNNATGEYGLAHIKTAEEMAANNTSKVSLDAPNLTRGLGYTVEWSRVANADYYYVYDSNDNNAYTVVMADEDTITYSYKAEVVGNHNIYVVAHSYYKAYNSSISNVVSTPEVKPVFSYKAMSDGLYKFSEAQMKTMGISTTGYYHDKSDDKYFAYYNKDIRWTPYLSMATDWTSPAEFPAHAQRLKDMGNNIIMIARDSNAEYKASESSFETSRLKYIMDTAWSMGMKVIVCDEVFYELSMSDEKASNNVTLEQVEKAIEARAGFKDYVTHPAFYGFSLDDEPYSKYLNAMSCTISALNTACENLGVSDPFFLACLFQAEGGTMDIEMYDQQSELLAYYQKWLNIDGVDGQYLYVDIYTQHAMGQPTNRYNKSFEVVYGTEKEEFKDFLGGKYKFYQAITAHTQNTTIEVLGQTVTLSQGVLLAQDMYMSLLYAAAHNVAGYSWFCYFPISGELSGSMVGFDGKGYGNGIGNKASGCYYDVAKMAGYQFELIQGWLDGYEWTSRSHSDSENLLTTTLSKGKSTATMYVNADVDNMSGSAEVEVSGKCYLIGYDVKDSQGNTVAYKVVPEGTYELKPGQAILCIK